MEVNIIVFFVVLTVILAYFRKHALYREFSKDMSDPIYLCFFLQIASVSYALVLVFFCVFASLVALHSRCFAPSGASENEVVDQQQRRRDARVSVAEGGRSSPTAKTPRFTSQRPSKLQTAMC